MIVTVFTVIKYVHFFLKTPQQTGRFATISCFSTPVLLFLLIMD